MALNLTYQGNPWMLGPVNPGSRTAYALDSAFTLGSAGKCMGVRFVAPATTTISYAMFFVTAAPASAHNLSVVACAYGVNGTRAGSALTNGTVSVSGGTTAGVWLKATFSTPPNITEGEVYWIVIGDPSGAASNYSVVSRASGSAITKQISFTSSDGFATNGTSVSTPFSGVVAFGDGSFLGNSVSASAVNHTNNTLERGIKVLFDVDTYVYGVTNSAVILPPATGSIKIYVDGEAPGGTIYSGFNAGVALPINDNASGISDILFSPCLLQGGVAYRVVYAYAANSTFPGYYAIEDYTHDQAALVACSLPGITHTIDDGAGGWTDDPSLIPRMSLMIASLPEEPTDAQIAAAVWAYGDRTTT